MISWEWNMSTTTCCPAADEIQVKTCSQERKAILPNQQKQAAREVARCPSYYPDNCKGRALPCTKVGRLTVHLF